MTPDGKVTTFDIPSGPTAEPFGLCAGSDGTIWFAEKNQCNRIGRVKALMEVELLSNQPPLAQAD